MSFLWRSQSFGPQFGTCKSRQFKYSEDLTLLIQGLHELFPPDSSSDLSCTQASPYSVSWALWSRSHLRAFAFPVASTWNVFSSRVAVALLPNLSGSVLLYPRQSPWPTICIFRALMATCLPFYRSSCTLGDLPKTNPSENTIRLEISGPGLFQ